MKSNLSEIAEGRPLKSEAEFLLWVSDAADALIRKIFWQVSGIALERLPERLKEPRKLVTIVSKVDGAYVKQLAFSAEFPLFVQIASNMLGDPSPSPEDAVDYAMELFNMFCGRLISEICQATRASARFYPPQYLAECRTADMMQSLYYLSGQGAYAQFSCDLDSVEHLLKRGSQLK